MKSHNLNGSDIKPSKVDKIWTTLVQKSLIKTHQKRYLLWGMYINIALNVTSKEESAVPIRFQIKNVWLG